MTCFKLAECFIEFEFIQDLHLALTIDFANETTNKKIITKFKVSVLLRSEKNDFEIVRNSKGYCETKSFASNLLFLWSFLISFAFSLLL